MTSIRQLYYKRVVRIKKKHYKRNLALRGCPQKKGFVMKMVYESPKKPNSAKRRVVTLAIKSTGRSIRVQLPGEGSGGLNKFHKVLMRGGHTRDLPGIRYRVLRGKLDSKPVYRRKKARSKYGVKKGIFNFLDKD